MLRVLRVVVLQVLAAAGADSSAAHVAVGLTQLTRNPPLMRS